MLSVDIDQQENISILQNEIIQFFLFVCLEAIDIGGERNSDVYSSWDFSKYVFDESRRLYDIERPGPVPYNGTVVVSSASDTPSTDPSRH